MNTVNNADQSESVETEREPLIRDINSEQDPINSDTEKYDHAKGIDVDAITEDSINARSGQCRYHHCKQSAVTRCERCNRWICQHHLKKQRVEPYRRNLHDQIIQDVLLCPDCVGSHKVSVCLFVMVIMLIMSLVLILVLP